MPELPGRLLRAGLVVWCLIGVATILLGSWWADAEIGEEMEAAMDLAGVLQAVHQTEASPLPDEEAIAALRAAVTGRTLRHLTLSLRDGQGQRLWGQAPAEPAARWLKWWVDQHRSLRAQQDPAPSAVVLHRPSGAVWTLIISPSPDSERRQALQVLVRLLAFVGGGGLVLLILLWLRVRHLLQPVDGVLRHLSRLRQGLSQETTESPEAPSGRLLREWQAVEAAVQQLEWALAGAEADRQHLAQRMHSVQEDERRRISQDLHDELGQRLTALRMDATVLSRLLSADAVTSTQTPPLESARSIAHRIATELQDAQAEIRALVRRLAPQVDAVEPAERLVALLQTLRPGSADLRWTLDVDLGDEPLPSGLVLAVFRMSQEAVTNALRHGHPGRISLAVVRRTHSLEWRCEDDGIGISDLAAAFQRGNGLQGMRQRAWAFGGHLLLSAGQPGLILRCVLQVAPPAAADAHGPAAESH